MTRRTQNFIKRFINRRFPFAPMSTDWHHQRVNTPYADGPDRSDFEVHAALDSADVDRIEEAFDQAWYDLPVRFAPDVVAAVRRADHGALDRRPRLFHLSALAHHFARHGGDDPQPRRLLQLYARQGRRYAARLTSFSDPRDLVAAGTLALVSARLQGRYDEAERIGAWTDKHLALHVGRAQPPWASTHPAARPGWLSAQRGLTAMLAGATDRAVQLYTRARAEAGGPPHGHYAGANALANLALLSAYRGHLGLARRRLTELEELGDLPAVLARLTASGATLARALVAIEELDERGAARHLREAGPAAHDLELWPFVAYAQALYDTVWGDPYAGLVRLDEARFAHGAQAAAPGTMTSTLLVQAEAALLVRTRAAGRVLGLSREHPAVGSLVVDVAWTQLRSGHHHQAIRTCAEALHRRPESVSDRIGLDLVLALAHLRLGNEDRAAAAFESALRGRSGPAHLRPFLGADGDDLRRLSDLAGVDADLPVPDLPGVRGPAPLVRLTPRELAVLQQLSVGKTAEGAAAALGVAPTTVRSQIRSLYRKLGASRRSEALASAHELGLLPVGRGPGR